MSIFVIPLLFISPIIAFLSLFYDLIYQKKGYAFILLMAIVLFFWVGLNYVPNTDSDLVRYFDIVQADSGYTLNYFYSNLISSGNAINIVQDSLFFFVSRFNNQQLLPAITTSLVFFSGFFVFLNAKRMTSSSSVFKILALCTFLSLMRIDIAAGNVRNISAVALIIIGIISYDMLERSYFIQLFFFILGLSMHIGAFPIVAIKLGIDLLYSLYKSKWLIFWGLTVLSLVSSILFIKLGIFDTVIGKFNEYSTGDVATSAWFQILQNSIKFKIYKYLIVLYLFFTIFLSWQQYFKFKTLRKINLFYIITSILTLIFALVQPGSTFLRYFYLQILLSSLIIMNYYDKVKNKNVFILINIFFIAVFLYYQIYYIGINIDESKFFKDTFLYPIWFEE
ncbi:EpsG family protein [Leuconostoc citreum]|uniref:EpsG family protein n=1 Tax=Leuconostoc citreum TaxID=33964 RepID=UPI00211AE0D5|nr:hypothetical protein [Leuconostoc citreum]MCQ6659448.1 hypothetical protein [Leuconostoc citreum]